MKAKIPADGKVHFQVCKCRKHGRLIFPDGRVGGEICSKEGAELLLHHAYLVNRFQDVDIFPRGSNLNDIMDEVERSKLPKDDSKAGQYTLKVVQTWNAAKTLNPNLDPADFHKVSDALWHYRDGD